MAKRPLITQKKKPVINDAASGKFGGQAPLIGGWVNADMPGMTKLNKAGDQFNSDASTDPTTPVAKKDYTVQDAAARAKGKRPFIPFKKKGK